MYKRQVMTTQAVVMAVGHDDDRVPCNRVRVDRASRGWSVSMRSSVKTRHTDKTTYVSRCES